MARDNQIIRTADICDNHRTDACICETQFKDVGGRSHFHGVAVCMSAYENNSGLRPVLAEGGQGRVLVVDGRGSFRRALYGGNIAIIGDPKNMHDRRDVAIYCSHLSKIGRTTMYLCL